MVHKVKIICSNHHFNTTKHFHHYPQDRYSPSFTLDIAPLPRPQSLFFWLVGCPSLSINIGLHMTAKTKEIEPLYHQFWPVCPLLSDRAISCWPFTLSLRKEWTNFFKTQFTSFYIFINICQIVRIPKISILHIAIIGPQFIFYTLIPFKRPPPMQSSCSNSQNSWNYRNTPRLPRFPYWSTLRYPTPPP